MKICFITVNYNGDDDTLKLIDQLVKCQTPRGTVTTIYVVDNDKSEKLKQEINKYKSVKYISSPGNIGYAAGNNIGLRQAISDKQDIITLINNDTLIPKNLIDFINKSPILNKQVGVVGGLIYFAKGYEYEKGYRKSELGKVIWYGGGKIDWDNVYVGHDLVNKVDTGDLVEKETPFVTGCLFITKPEVLKKAGLFEESYCLYLEDADLCERIKKVGFKLLFDPKIKIWHKVAQGSGIGSSLNDYFLTRNRLLFGFTYAKPRTKIALLREAIKKLFIGTKSQKVAIKDFFTNNYGWGSWKK